MKKLLFLLTLVLFLMSIVSCSDVDSINKLKLPVESDTYFTHRDIMYIIIDRVEFRDSRYEEGILKSFNINIRTNEYFGINNDVNGLIDGTLWFDDILPKDGSIEGIYTISDRLKQTLAGEIHKLVIDVVIGGEESKLGIAEGTLTIEVNSENAGRKTYELTLEGKDHVGKEIKL